MPCHTMPCHAPSGCDWWQIVCDAGTLGLQMHVGWCVPELWLRACLTCGNASQRQKGWGQLDLGPDLSD